MKNSILVRKIQKIEVKNFAILNIRKNFSKNTKIGQKFDVKRNVTFDFVGGFCPFFHQMIRAWRTPFDEKFRTLGAFFQKLSFFVRDVGIYHANDVCRRSFFFKSTFTQNYKAIMVIYTPYIMYFHAKE